MPTDRSNPVPMIAVVASVFAVLVSVVAVIAVNRTEGGATLTAASPVAVSLTEWAVTPEVIEVGAGQVLLQVSNDGTMEHDLALEGGAGTSMLAPGASELLDLGSLEPGSYELICTVPGHADSGMVATLVVSEDAPAGAAAAHDAHDHGADADWAALDAAMMESMEAFPAETEGLGNQPLEPTILPDGTKEFDLTVAITDWEVEPGVIVDAWTYNGQVPGPMIQVDVGDRIRVNVQNDLPAGTDVHWHGVSVPNDQDGVAPYTQPLIEAGETFTYEFVVEEPAVGMYHAHAHGQVAIPNGLFGVFLAGDVPLPLGRTIGGRAIPDEIEIAQEIPMVVNDAGVIGLTLNGKSFPATEPYVFELGDWFLVHYYNEGLQVHPMHLHQFPQLVIAKDGHPLDVPYWEDTVNVAPGERYTVLVHANREGTWVWHCHILNHVERASGMFGMVTAVIVE